MRAQVLLLLVTGCSLDHVMDDCGEPIRVTAPPDSLVVFHHDDGTPVAQTVMTGQFVELAAPSCHGAVTVIDGAEARTLTGVAPGEWIDFRNTDRAPNTRSVTAIDRWSMRVDVANADTDHVYAHLDYVVGDELVDASDIPIPFVETTLVRGVPIRITMGVRYDNGVYDVLVEDLPGVQPEVVVDAARAPHIEEVGWTRDPRRSFTYRLSAPADAVAGCESWKERLTWCVFGAASDALVMPRLPPGLEPWGPPVVGFLAIDLDAGRVVGTSRYASDPVTTVSAALPIRVVAP